MNIENEPKYRYMRTISASVLAVNLVFVAEFQFSMANYLHLCALALFALTIPILGTNAYVSILWESGNKFSNWKREVHFSISTHSAVLISIAAIGLCIWAYSFIAGIAYIVGCLYFFYIMICIEGIKVKE